MSPSNVGESGTADADGSAFISVNVYCAAFASKLTCSRAGGGLV
jgi:hypothetical protein